MKTIYLAGPMLGFSYEEMNDWRSYISNKFLKQYNFINPARRLYDEHKSKFLVENDKREIDLSDILLVNHIIPSDGTAMEILYAWERKKYILVIIEGVYSPWIKYHSNHIVKNIDEAINFLKDNHSTL